MHLVRFKHKENYSFNNNCFMKKSVLLGALTLAFASTGAYAQEIVEVDEVVQVSQISQWVGDCSQGRLINKNKDNWFITLQGGANMLFGEGDIHADIKDRIDGAGAIYLGKWVTPTFGFRFGANYIMTKGATQYGGDFIKWNAPNQLVKGDNDVQKGWYAQKWMGLGPEFDVMISLTNWWCGYRPGRVYNAVLHGGAGAYWRWAYKAKGGAFENNVGETFFNDAKWHGAHNTILFATLGLQQNFRLSKHVDFFIDLQYQLIDEKHPIEHGADVYLGFNFNLGKTDWNCPVVPICDDAQYIEDIQRQKRKIQDLEIEKNQLVNRLQECEQRPTTKTVTGECSQLVTIYYPINQYDLSAREKKVLKSVADVMLAHPDQRYDLVGWADNWTGSNDYNETLRWNRVNGVKNYLLSCGVPESQLNVNIDNNNLVASPEFDEFNASVIEAKSAPLDRAVTIRLAD